MPPAAGAISLSTPLNWECRGTLGLAQRRWAVRGQDTTRQHPSVRPQGEKGQVPHRLGAPKAGSWPQDELDMVLSLPLCLALNETTTSFHR